MDYVNDVVKITRMTMQYNDAVKNSCNVVCLIFKLSCDKTGV